MRLYRHGAALPPLLLIAGFFNASAWDKDGHEAIGMTTMSALEGAAVAQVKHLMGGRDAVDVAAWAHKVNKKYPWTVPLHFQPQPSWACNGADTSVCSENRCLVKALKHFYGRLTNQQLVTIDWPKDMHLTDADAVKYLINLIGDLHQPMHLSAASEDMGRNLSVTFRGKKTTMFDLWDSGLTQAIMHDSPSFWWGGWTHVQRTRVEYEKDGEKWKKDGVVSFDHWADETSKFLCENVHTNPVTGRHLWENQKEVSIDPNLFEIWKREMLSRMLVAGARTAIVLNAILKHREGMPELHVGTSVKGLEGEEEDTVKKVPAHGRKGDSSHHSHGAEEGLKAACINLGIFSFTGAVFLQVMKMWQGRDAVNQATREKLTQADGGKKT